MTILFSSIAAILLGDGLFVLIVFALFIILQHLQSTLATWIDGDDPKLIAYSVFAVIGYKQIIDVLLIKAGFEMLLKRNAPWTRSQRFGSKTLLDESQPL